MKIIITGDRDFNNYDLLETKCDNILKNIKERITIVSGTLDGADRIGETYASNKGHLIEYIPPNRYLYGIKANMVRNKDMVALADSAIVFTNLEKNGVVHIVDLIKEKGIPHRIINY